MMSGDPGLQSVGSPASCFISRFLWMVPPVLKSEGKALWVPWSHSRSFCEAESKCDPNHAPVGSRGTWRDALSGPSTDSSTVFPGDRRHLFQCRWFARVHLSRQPARGPPWDPVIFWVMSRTTSTGCHWKSELYRYISKCRCF